jgi:uncharacterized protein (TIGR02266 family)
MTSAKQEKKLIAVFDPVARSRELLGEFLDRMGYQVELHTTSGKISRLVKGRDADLIVVNLAVFGSNYTEVITELERLGLAGDEKPPILAVTSLSISREARGRIEQLGAQIVIDQKAPFMELVFSVNLLLFPKMRELRQYARVFGGFPIQYLQAGEWHAGKVYNISRQGAFIQCDDPPAENTRLDVRFVLPGRDDRMRVAANVNWVNTPANGSDSLAPYGMGVSFLVLDREDSTSLDQFISERVNGNDPSGESSPSCA